LIYHQLFSEDGDNRCLYCQGKCEFFAGEGGGAPPLLYFIDQYACQTCSEKFSVHYIYGLEGDPFGFGFTCNELTISHNYRKSTIKIALKERFQETIEVPAFEYDFTDKETLYQRLRTCLTFA
jgi:hypothetical protein